MSKAIINALAMKLALEFPGYALPEALTFGEAFVAENAELFTYKPDKVAPQAMTTKPRSAYELSAEQEQALATGVGLCPNCQQPKNDHLPGCSRAFADPNDPFLKGAITKNKLNPVA